MHTCDICGDPCDCAADKIGYCAHCTPDDSHDDALDDYESDFETGDDYA